MDQATGEVKQATGVLLEELEDDPDLAAWHEELAAEIEPKIPPAPIVLELVSDNESERDEAEVTNLYQRPSASMIRAANKMHVPSATRPDRLSCSPHKTLAGYRIVDEDIEDVHAQRLCQWCVIGRPSLFSEETVAFHLEHLKPRDRAQWAESRGSSSGT